MAISMFKALMCSLAIAPVFLLQSVAAQTESDTSQIIQINQEAFKLYGNDAFEMEAMGKKALELSQQINYQQGIAASQNTIALANMSQGFYKLAAEYFIEALKIYDALGDEESASNILSNIGVVYYYLEDHKRSLDYHKRALETRLVMQDSQQIAKSLNNLGIAERNLGNQAEALSYYLKALEYKTELGDSLGISSTLNNIGNVYLEQSKYDLALEYFAQSLEIDQLNNRQLGVATSLVNIGDTHMKKGDLKTAEEYLQKAIGLAKGINARKTLEIAYNRMSELYKQQKQYREALEWQDKWVVLKDSLSSSEKSRAINDIETRYQTSKIRAENQLLMQKQALQEVQLSKQQTLIIASTIIGVLLLILAIVSFRGYSLKRKNLKLEQRKTEEVTQKNKLISQQKVQLEEINEAKNRMFSILSHDLRAPVARLQSVLELANLDMISEEELNPLIKRMSKETNEVGELLSNVLEWVKTQMGGLSINPQKLNLKEVSSSVMEIYLPFAAGKGVEVINNIDTQLVFADEDMLKLIFRNLLANAIKFTSEGKITLSCSQEGEMTSIIIADTGIGMSQSDVEKLFSSESFTKEGTAKEKGSGLGLMLVKEFVLKSGGTINVSSQMGKGTQFEFTLPTA